MTLCSDAEISLESLMSAEQNLTCNDNAQMKRSTFFKCVVCACVHAFACVCVCSTFSRLFVTKNGIVVVFLSSF